MLKTKNRINLKEDIRLGGAGVSVAGALWQQRVAEAELVTGM